MKTMTTNTNSIDDTQKKTRKDLTMRFKKRMDFKCYEMGCLRVGRSLDKKDINKKNVKLSLCKRMGNENGVGR